MAVLYCIYIVIFAVCNPILGRYIDSVYSRSHETTIRPALINTVGVQFTILAATILASTFVPHGSWSFNPAMLSGERSNSGEVQLEHDSEAAAPVALQLLSSDGREVVNTKVNNLDDDSRTPQTTNINR